ncbi:hypothetical protein NDI56_12775 [Haloarcula sp. S1CR25-12]|uniref:Uncharacterized protein n=1 Tax=Haloarcula saliterrae TaxID=2950534 RepID=A0ABU2FEX2_9EURY|nr:DUF6544 family protein [Haloarcula sp. S1CR25-12]MDS0260270.1 hypothetical protein [Haloarcula sp. S1CR25-12]
MQYTRALGRVAVGAGTLLAAALAARRLRSRRSAQRIAALYRPSTTGRDATFDPADAAGLPAPVRRYLTSAIPEGHPLVDTARIEQTGQLRTGDAASSWLPFSATHHVTVDPPGFLWDASVRAAPAVSVSVRDRFCDGEGSAAVSLFGVVPLDSVGTSPELVEAELQRYLAEAVWYPTALLPREGVQWDPIDERTAEATVEHRGVSASLTVSFTDDEVRAVHTERYRRVDDGFELTPWTGRWDDYERRNGLRVPLSGEVIWHRPEGELRAWQGRVTDIEYDGGV